VSFFQDKIFWKNNFETAKHAIHNARHGRRIQRPLHSCGPDPMITKHRREKRRISVAHPCGRLDEAGAEDRLVHHGGSHGECIA